MKADEKFNKNVFSFVCRTSSDYLQTVFFEEFFLKFNLYLKEE